jgi:hypothetical protein
MNARSSGLQAKTTKRKGRHICDGLERIEPYWTVKLVVVPAVAAAFVEDPTVACT